MKWHKFKMSMNANGPQTTVWREIGLLKTCPTKTNLLWQTDRSSLIERFKFKSSMASGLIPHKARTDQWILMTFKGRFQKYHRYYQCHTIKTYLTLRMVSCSTLALSNWAWLRRHRVKHQHVTKSPLKNHQFPQSKPKFSRLISAKFCSKRCSSSKSRLSAVISSNCSILCLTLHQKSLSYTNLPEI